MKSDWYKKDIILLGEYVEKYIDDYTVCVHNKEEFAKACFEAFIQCGDDPSYEKFVQNMHKFPSSDRPTSKEGDETIKSFLGMPYRFDN